MRVQCTLILGRRTAPEPDVAVVPGQNRDYANAHPKTALLVVEVADSTLAQDRLTKAAIYAAAGIPEYRNTGSSTCVRTVWKSGATRILRLHATAMSARSAPARA